ncbi:hypothetical protein BpHYR1_012923 [Brachionus plicatilis]|uniref:Uncharacterized protein n=1 Tax=Brachionus plicatilis TaxID=10195 RepID=A0A3M7P8B3_BRAPC|nr:hypothetical protein BpHYR1_012923 [Brachionus plicatilis]
MHSASIKYLASLVSFSPLACMLSKLQNDLKVTWLPTHFDLLRQKYQNINIFLCFVNNIFHMILAEFDYPKIKFQSVSVDRKKKEKYNFRIYFIKISNLSTYLNEDDK